MLQVDLRFWDMLRHIMDFVAGILHLGMILRRMRLKNNDFWVPLGFASQDCCDVVSHVGFVNVICALCLLRAL